MLFGDVGFYSVLPLVYLPCYWLVGRACGSGQVNGYRLHGKEPSCLTSITVELLQPLVVRLQNRVQFVVACSDAIRCWLSEGGSI